MGQNSYRIMHSITFLFIVPKVRKQKCVVWQKKFSLLLLFMQDLNIVFIFISSPL